MSDPLLLPGRQRLRATDTNSLLRLYDRAAEIFRQSPFQHERQRADKVMQVIATELAKRNVPL